MEIKFQKCKEFFKNILTLNHIILFKFNEFYKKIIFKKEKEGGEIIRITILKKEEEVRKKKGIKYYITFYIFHFISPYLIIGLMQRVNQKNLSSSSILNNTFIIK